MGTHASITVSTARHSAAIRDYRYFEYTTPPNQTPIKDVHSDPQLKRLVISIKKKNASPSSEQTSQGVLGSVIQWILGKPQKPTQRKSSVPGATKNSNGASSSSMNGVAKVPASTTRSGASSTTRAIPTSASRTPLQENDHEIIFLTAPNSWYGKFISWIFGSYQDIAKELQKELGEKIIDDSTYKKICKKGITVAELKELYEKNKPGDTATPASDPSGSISSMTSTESLLPGTSIASIASWNSNVTPPSAPPSRSRSSSISSISSAIADASDPTDLPGESIPTSAPAINTYMKKKASMEVPETIPPGEPEDIVANNGHQKDPTGAALMRFDTFAPVANNTHPVVNSPIEENKDNSPLSNERALLSALNNVITTADPSAPVRFNSPMKENQDNSPLSNERALFNKLNNVITTADPSTKVKLNSLDDLNTFLTTRMSILNPKRKEKTKTDATNQHLSEDVLNQITTIMDKEGYELVVNKESGTFKFTSRT